MPKKSVRYQTPKITEKKLRYSFFFNKSGVFDNLNIFGDVYAQSSGNGGDDPNTGQQGGPNNPPPGGGGSGGNGGGSGSGGNGGSGS